jgi:hypothetical protein
MIQPRQKVQLNFLIESRAILASKLSIFFTIPLHGEAIFIAKSNDVHVGKNLCSGIANKRGQTQTKRKENKTGLPHLFYTDKKN